MKRLVVMMMCAWAAPAVAAGEPREECTAKKGHWLVEGGADGCRVNGQREGLWVKRFPSGQLQESVTWAN